MYVVLFALGEIVVTFACSYLRIVKNTLRKGGLPLLTFHALICLLLFYIRVHILVSSVIFTHLELYQQTTMSVYVHYTALKTFFTVKCKYSLSARLMV